MNESHTELQYWETWSSIKHCNHIWLESRQRAEREREQKLMRGHVDKDKVFTAQESSHRPSGRNCTMTEPLGESDKRTWGLAYGKLITQSMQIVHIFVNTMAQKRQIQILLFKLYAHRPHNWRQINTEWYNLIWLHSFHKQLKSFFCTHVCKLFKLYSIIRT